MPLPFPPQGGRPGIRPLPSASSNDPGRSPRTTFWDILSSYSKQEQEYKNKQEKKLKTAAEVTAASQTILPLKWAPDALQQPRHRKSPVLPGPAPPLPTGLARPGLCHVPSSSPHSGRTQSSHQLHPGPACAPPCQCEPCGGPTSNSGRGCGNQRGPRNTLKYEPKPQASLSMSAEKQVWKQVHKVRGERQVFPERQEHPQCSV